jgi:two-component sensor histidine kinase
MRRASCIGLTVEDELRRSNARLEALLREANHRVANSLQLVSGFVGMESRATLDPMARGVLQDTQRRIQAIVRLHRLLCAGDGVDEVAMDDYLAGIVGDLEEIWSTPMAPRMLTLASESIRMQTGSALALGAIVSELVSNACKYAYPSTASGEIRITLRAECERHLLLIVEDDGRGIQRGATNCGFGLGAKMIRTLTQSLQATLSFDPAHIGLRAIVQVPRSDTTSLDLTGRRPTRSNR